MITVSVKATVVQEFELNRRAAAGVASRLERKGKKACPTERGLARDLRTMLARPECNLITITLTTYPLSNRLSAVGSRVSAIAEEAA